MNKKRYLIIIAIIIFIFLALFTFANPLNNGEGEPNDNRVLEEIDEDDLINNGQNDKNTDEETEENTPVYNNHGVNVENILRVEDNSYELALNAVVRAEVSLDEEKYNIALDLVSKVTDEDKKEVLQERLKIVLDTMELIKLVKELVEITNESKNKVQLDSAREYQVSNEIIDRITKLVNETLKDSLTEEVGTVLYLLNDEADPTINIDDEAILSEVTKINVKDKNEFTIILTKDGEESKVVENGIEVSDGVYTLKVVDVAFNEVTITFTVDTTKPTGEVTYSTTEIINGEVVATLNPSETVTVTNNNGSFEYTFTENGSFTFEFVDRAGNKGTATATVENIDTEKPGISIGGTTGSKYWFQEQTFNTVITEENIDSVYYVWNNSSNDNSMKRDLDGKSAIKVDLSTLTDNGDGTYTLSVTLNTEGRYVFNVKVVDKAGNVEYDRKGWYQIDRTAPSMQVGDIVYGPEHTDVIYSPDRFKATAVDTASGIDKIYSNGQERPKIDVNGNGNYTFTLVDKAGNTSKFKVIVDKVDPSYNYVGIMNIDQTTEGYAKVGDRVWVYVVVDEHLSQEPTIKINGETAKIVQTEDGANFGADWYKYVGEVVMTEEMSEGEIEFTISGYKDLAGNEGKTLTNANINNGISAIELDKTNPGYNYVGIMNIDQKTEGYAKVGDRVWVYVVVDEHLSQEPTIKINGETAKIVQTEDGANFGADWYKYVGEVKMTEEMSEGEIEFTISGYEDLAGNPGDTLANANINNGISAIELDKTAPTYKTYKGKITYDKYKVEPIIIDDELYFFGETTFNFNDNVVIKEQHVDNGIYIGWQQGVQKIFNTPGKHTIKMVDASGNETSVTFTILDERLNITNIDELETALNELDEITLYKDLDLGTDNPLIIASGQNKVINLNGKKITGKSTKSTTSNLIEVKSGASLRLEGNGEISFLAIEPDTEWDPEGFPTYANNTIKNSGKLVIDGPIIKNNTAKGGASYAIDNYPGAELEIIDGTIIQTGGDTAIRLFANSATVPTNVTVNGGSITGNYAILIQLPSSNSSVAPTVNLTINGGTFASSNTTYNFAIYSYSNGNSFINTNVTINNGIFEGGVVFGGGVNADKENVTISGGTFNSYLGRYLPGNGWEDLK